MYVLPDISKHCISVRSAAEIEVIRFAAQFCLRYSIQLVEAISRSTASAFVSDIYSNSRIKTETEVTKNA